MPSANCRSNTTHTGYFTGGTLIGVSFFTIPLADLYPTAGVVSYVMACVGMMTLGGTALFQMLTNNDNNEKDPLISTPT